MPTFAPSFTPRYRAHYHVCGIDHTIQLRKSLGASPASTALLAGTLASMFTAAAALLCDDFAWISAEQADQGSDLFYPSTMPAPVTGLKAIGVFTPFQKATHTRFAGRSLGSRAAAEMFGIWWEFSNRVDDTGQAAYDGIVTPAEVPFIGTIVTLLTGQAFSVKGDATSWYPRATVKVNDFWLKAVRKGGIT